MDAAVTAPMIVRTNTILYCRAWVDTVRFYRDGLAFRAVHETDWFVEFALGTAGAHLSVADVRRATIASGAGAGITLSWQVHDLDRTARELASRGLTVGPIRPHAWGARVCYLRDPEGHRIELWTPAASPPGA